MISNLLAGLILLILPMSKTDVVVYKDRGIALAPDGKLWTLQNVETVSVIHRLFPPEHILSFHVCNGSFQPYAHILSDFKAHMKSINHQRPKRFLSIMGLISGVVGSTLSAKNWIDIKVIERDLSALKQRQLNLISWADNTTSKLNDQVRLTNMLITSWNKYKSVATTAIGMLRCRTDFLLQVMPDVISNIKILEQVTSAIISIWSYRSSQKDLNIIVNYPKIKEVINKHIPHGHLPGIKSFFKLIDIVPGYIDMNSLTATFVLIVPIFKSQPMSTYFILNTGYIDSSHTYRQCDIHGLVVYQKQLLLQIHPDSCTTVGKQFFCPPHATLIDPRMRILHKDYLCQTRDSVHFPVVQYRQSWIAITTIDKTLSFMTDTTGIERINHSSSDNGFFIVDSKTVAKVWSGSIVIYQHLNVITGGAELYRKISFVNHSHFDDYILQKQPDLSTIGPYQSPSVSHRGSTDTHTVVINTTIVIVIVFLGICVALLTCKFARLKKDHQYLVQLQALNQRQE
nr:MAG: putative glycoprotein [Usmuvirus newyorkense]